MTAAKEQTWHWRVDVGADRNVLALSGEIDMSGVDRLDDLLHETIAQAGTVEIDLARLTFIDSTVLSTLVGAHHHAAGRGADLTLVNAAGQVRRVLDMTGVTAEAVDPLVEPSPAHGSGGPRRCWQGSSARAAGSPYFDGLGQPKG